MLKVSWLGFSKPSHAVYSPPYVDRIWCILGSYYDMPKARFYLLKGGCRVLGWGCVKIGLCLYNLNCIYPCMAVYELLEILGFPRDHESGPRGPFCNLVLSLAYSLQNPRPLIIWEILTAAHTTLNRAPQP